MKFIENQFIGPILLYSILKIKKTNKKHPKFIILLPKNDDGANFQEQIPLFLRKKHRLRPRRHPSRPH